MRLIPTFCLREGMIVAQPVQGTRGEMLLHKGATLNSFYIKRLSDMGMSGLYIDDKETEDIELKQSISHNLRNKTVQTIKNTFMEVGKGKPQTIQQQKSIGDLIKNIMEEILENKNTMFNMVDLKVFDDYTYYHSVNVAVVSMVLGMGMNLKNEELYRLGLGALLHDIGKVFIHKDILNKPGKLTSEEYEVMKTHSFLGYQYLKEHFDVPVTSYIAALQHHERYDGSGYPNNLKGTGISLFGRIMAVADVYDALTSDRPYRKGMLPSEATEYIMGGMGTMFDPEVVNVFVKKVAPYPVGTKVQLSNGEVGFVSENYEGMGSRPSIKVVEKNGESVESYILHLKDRNSLSITITDIIRVEEKELVVAS